MEDSPPLAIDALYHDLLSIEMNEYPPFKKKKQNKTKQNIIS